MNTQLHSYLTRKAEIQAKGGQAGPGAFAKEWIYKHELIAVWSGYLVRQEHLSELPEAIQKHTVQVEEDLYLASWTEDEPADYINHSCDPNAALEGQLSLIALRDIAPGEEIRFDYATSDGSPYDEFLCDCKSDNCRGRVTGHDWMLPDLWLRYQGHFSPYLQRRIDKMRESLAAPQVHLNGSG